MVCMIVSFEDRGHEMTTARKAIRGSAWSLKPQRAGLGTSTVGNGYEA